MTKNELKLLCAMAKVLLSKNMSVFSDPSLDRSLRELDKALVAVEPPPEFHGRANMTIELGQVARDKITGFTGVLIGRCQYLTGCDQYGLVPPAKDNKVEPAQWFDEGRIELLGGGVSVEDVTTQKNGGPNRDAP